MNPNLVPDDVRAEVDRIRVEDDAGRRALAEPLPGPLRDALAIDGAIKVGRWSVRPFYDIDYEFLSMLDHPLYRMMRSAMAGGPEPDDDMTPRGPTAWELAYILTREPDAVEAVIKEGGVAALKENAKREFSRLRKLRELADLTAACVKQMGVYWSPVIAYGEKQTKIEGEEGGQDNEVPFPPSAGRWTVSAGSSTSAVG